MGEESVSLVRAKVLWTRIKQARVFSVSFQMLFLAWIVGLLTFLMYIQSLSS